MKVKTVYYTDALNDDFAGTKITHKGLKKGYKFVHKNPIWRFFSWLIYYVIAVPVLFLVGKIGYGVKVKGKRNLYSVRHQGVFLYGNHTQIADAWMGQCFVLNPKRTYVLANTDAVSIKGVRWLVMMLGCIPVPEDLDNKDGFKDAIMTRYNQRAGIAIFPERHIWKYCTHIRPFPDDSFVYPAELGAPVVAMCTTYRKRKLFKNLPPRMTVHVSKPFFPDMNLSIAERKKALRTYVYDFMIHHSAEDENIEYVRYIKKSEKKDVK